MGWTTISRDGGATWSQPLVPPTLVTGKAKVWAQRTRDGRYALVYNPSRRNRFPLAVVTSDDGVHFRDMRIVQGELPVQRYAGLHRSIGPQYVRGISRWSDDGSRGDEQVMWIVYSMNKEDIWVSRVPLSVKAEMAPGDEPAWNVYSPKWAPVLVEGNELRLADSDPYDYACATRVVSAHDHATVSFDALAEQAGAALEMELVEDDPPAPPRRLPIICNVAGEWQSYRIEGSSLRRVSFRTKPWRGIGGAHPVPRESDRPAKRVAFRIRRFGVGGR
jgi:hypothetical protein